jgi:hypothetical protein
MTKHKSLYQDCQKKQVKIYFIPAKIAFFKTLGTRYILPTPMFIPPIIIYYMKKANSYPKGRALSLALDLSKEINI